MKNLRHFAAVISICAIITSCKKETNNNPQVNDDNNKQQIVGSWIRTRFAFDNNHNDMADENEFHNYPDSNGTALLTFFADSKGEQHRIFNQDTLDGLTFQWEVENNGSRIRLTYVFSGESQYLLIHSISASGMVLSDTGTINGRPSTSWFYYDRM